MKKICACLVLIMGVFIESAFCSPFLFTASMNDMKEQVRTSRLSAGFSWNVQNVILGGQPEPGQGEVELGIGFGSVSFFFRNAGLGANSWGGVGIETLLFGQNECGLNVGLDFTVGLPSRTLSLAALGSSIGQDFPSCGWSFAFQAGTASSPLPNQRPVGVNLLLGAACGGYVVIREFLRLAAEFTITPYQAFLYPGISLEAPLPLNGGRTSARFTIGLPLRVRYARPEAPAFDAGMPALRFSLAHAFSGGSE